jgi:hypothetical protein
MGSNTDADRGYIDWKPNKRTKEMLGQALEIVRSYSERGLPAPTPRDVLYDMVSYYGYGKDIKEKLYRLLRKARRAKMIGFDDLTDDTGALKHVGGYRGVSDFWTKVQSRAYDYTRDLEDNQPVHLELLCEGKGKVQQLAQISRDARLPSKGR